MYILASLLIPSLASALAIGSRQDSCLRAAYILDNNPAGSNILSLQIGQDGTLSHPVLTSTGGFGAWGEGGTPPTPDGADTLISQDSVLVVDDYLFTVNAGSNTLSMFFIDGNDPSHPHLLNTAPTLGEFPMSVAYSSIHKTACVLNGGAIAGVTCFSTDHAKGLTPVGGLRPIALGQTTPPVGPPNTASDILFNPSESAVFVTIKGSPTVPGFIYVYPVTPSGLISTTPIVSSPSALRIDFALVFLGTDSRAAIADPAFGGAILSIAHDYTVTVLKQITVPGQSAICWVEYDARFNTIFFLDAGTANITLVDATTYDVTGAIVQANFATAKGSFDSKPNQNFLYVLRGGDYVSVLDNTGLSHGKIPTEIQTFDLTSVAPRQVWQGLAVYPL